MNARPVGAALNCTPLLAQRPPSAWLLISSAETAVCKPRALGGGGDWVECRSGRTGPPSALPRGRASGPGGRTKCRGVCGRRRRIHGLELSERRQAGRGTAAPRPRLLSVTPGLRGRGCGSLIGKFGGTGGTVRKKRAVGNGAAGQLCRCSGAWTRELWGLHSNTPAGLRPSSPSCTELPGPETRFLADWGTVFLCD